MNKYLIEICDTFIKKYERSIKSNGGVSNKRIFLNCNKDIESYSIGNYDKFEAINNELLILEEKKFITAHKNKYDEIEKYSLNEKEETIQYLYSCLERTPKKYVKEILLDLLNKYRNKNDILRRFCDKQIENITNNKKVNFFNGVHFQNYEELLRTIDNVLNQKNEILIRVLSKNILNDSKRLEKLKSKLESILFTYGDFAQRETVFEELNIVKTPSFIYIKGDVTIGFKNNNTISTKGLVGGYGLSSLDIKNISTVTINCENIVTIENLSSYFLFDNNDFVSVYLGGFHNSAKREFLKTVAKQNTDLKFYHFGDIDAGGFYILEHLKRKTGIDFIAMNMDIETLEKYKSNWQPLTNNDKNRLDCIKNSSNGLFTDVINFMLEHDCKLEQEAINK